MSALTPPSRPRAHRPRRTGGFTLVELMITLTVMAVVVVIAAPSFQDAILGQRLTGYANSFMASVTLARSEAIKRNATVSVCRSADAATCAASGGWQQGWIVLAGTTVLQKQDSLPDGFRFTGDNYRIDFSPTGLGATDSTLLICRVNNASGEQKRSVRVYGTGRIAVTKTSTGTCS